VELEFVLSLSLSHAEGHDGEAISTLFSSINSAIWIINWGWGRVYAALLENILLLCHDNIPSCRGVGELPQSPRVKCGLPDTGKSQLYVKEVQ